MLRHFIFIRESWNISLADYNCPDDKFSSFFYTNSKPELLLRVAIIFDPADCYCAGVKF